MDKVKTGELIAQMRKQEKMTQAELAAILHVTSKAVSKWERGLNFPSVDILLPLSKCLKVSVVDLLAGEKVDEEVFINKSEEVSIDLLHHQKQIKKRFITITCSIVIFFVVLLSSLIMPYIMQRGNPLPYWRASISVNEQTPLITVDEKQGVYISKKDGEDALISFVEDKWNVRFVERMGSVLVFGDDENTYQIMCEVYWGKYLVWEVLDKTLLNL